MCYAGGMAAPEALSVPGDSTAPEAAAVPEAGAASQRLPQLIPVAQLIAVVLGVFGIIWHQQQTTDNLRTELMAEIRGLETELSGEISGLETELSGEISGVETGLSGEINSLRAEVAENGQRLARIEGFLGIGVPDDPPPSNP